MRTNGRWLLGGLLLALFSGFGQTFFIAISTGSIREAFDLSSGEYGQIYMIATLGSALTLPLIGRIVDKYSVNATIVFTCFMLAGACLLLAFAKTTIMLLIALYALRLFGQGMMTHISMTAMGKWFDENRGKAVSIASLGFSGGQALLPVTFVVMLAYMDWRQGWMVAAFVIIFVALPSTWLLMRKERLPRGTAVKEDSATSNNWTRAMVMRDIYFWIAIIGIMTMPFIGTTVYFHLDFMLETKGWGLDTFAASIIVSTIVSVFAKIFSGVVVDRYSAAATLPIFLIPLGTGCMALAFGAGPWALYTYMVLQGVSIGFYSTSVGALWPEVYGQKHLGSIRSLVVSMMVLFSALGPGVIGWAIDAGVSFTTQMAVMGAYCFLSAFALSASAWKYRQRARTANLA